MYNSIKDLIAQHFQSVEQVFQDFQISSPVNEITLSACVSKYGDPFIEALEDEISADFAGFKDKETRKANKEARKAARQEKKGAEGGGGGGKFGSWIKENAGNLLGSIATGVGTAIQNRRRKGEATTTDEDAGAASTKPPLTDKEKEEAEKKAKETKTFWIIGSIAAGLLILGTIVLLATSSSAKRIV